MDEVALWIALAERWKEAARQAPHQALKICYQKRADRCLIMMAWAKNGSREPGLPEASTS